MTPQPFHIFQKDVRHLWPETLVVLALFVAFAWAVPYAWHTTEYSQFIVLLKYLLDVLIPISWLIVISRLIHDESLVGDRQFWTSRPYHWASLLASKLLYLVIFIYLPFFLMQVYLLKHAGLYPTAAIPALLSNLFLLTVVFIIPIVALAAVTSSFPRLLLSTIGAILYVLVAGGLFAYLLFRHMPPPHFGLVAKLLVLVLPIVALVLQYATRKTPIARALLLATPVVVIVLLAIIPAGALIRNAYPTSSSADEPKLSALPIPENAKQTGDFLFRQGDALLNIPLKVEGVDKDSNYAIQGVAASYTGSAGSWSSPFLTSLGSSINGSLPYTLARFGMARAAFEKVGDNPVDLHLSLATDHLKALPPSTWKSSLLPFSIPGKGVCFSSSDDPDASPTCRFPLHAPEILFASGNVTPGTCAQPQSAPIPARASLSGSVDLLDFDPVAIVPLAFQTGDPDPRHHYQLCPATPLTFLQAHSVGKIRFEVDLKSVKLSSFALRQPVARQGGGIQVDPGQGTSEPGDGNGPTQ